MIYVFGSRWLVKSTWFTSLIAARWPVGSAWFTTLETGDWLDQRGLRFRWQVIGWVSVVYVFEWLRFISNLVHKVGMSALIIGACFYCPTEICALFNPWRVLKDRVCFWFKVRLRFLIYVYVFRPEITLCGWLDMKNPVTNSLTHSQTNQPASQPAS